MIQQTMFAYVYMCEVYVHNDELLSGSISQTTTGMNSDPAYNIMLIEFAL